MERNWLRIEHRFADQIAVYIMLQMRARSFALLGTSEGYSQLDN
jgi:hypothetical protein